MGLNVAQTISIRPISRTTTARDEIMNIHVQNYVITGTPRDVLMMTYGRRNVIRSDLHMTR